MSGGAPQRFRCWLCGNMPSAANPLTICNALKDYECMGCAMFLKLSPDKLSAGPFCGNCGGSAAWHPNVDCRLFLSGKVITTDWKRAHQQAKQQPIGWLAPSPAAWNEYHERQRKRAVTRGFGGGALEFQEGVTSYFKVPVAERGIMTLDSDSQ